MSARLATAALPSALPATATSRALDKEVVAAAIPDQSWESWTTRPGLIAFMAPVAELEPRVGGAFRIYFDPLATPGSRGLDEMRFMALVPRRMLSFDWNAPPSLPEARRQRTFVVVRFIR